MATNKITVSVVDEGFFTKTFCFKPTMSLKKLIDAYRVHVCRECTNAALLEFWFEATKLENQTAKVIGMQDGDTIDVRIRERCTRGACPVAPEQTLPNIHYLTGVPTSGGEEQITESSEALTGPDRIRFIVREVNGIEMHFHMKKTTRMVQVMQAFAQHIQREVGELFFLIDGQKIFANDTPGKLELEENDVIDAYYDNTGGMGMRTWWA